MLDRKKRPTQAEAEEALRVLLDFAGDDPNRDGLQETPSRVARAYGEWFAGYNVDAEALLDKTFEEADGYKDIVLLRDIELISTCEHHMAPIIGKVHVAYIPKKRIVGLSKLVRVVDALARRLQVQERLTNEIAQTLQNGLKVDDVAVMIEAEHFCMRTRGVSRSGVLTATKSFRGAFASEPRRAETLMMMRGHS